MSDYNSEKKKNFFTEEVEKNELPIENKKLIIKKKFKIVLVANDYIVVNNAGNNQLVLGKFEGKKIGDEVEIEV
jgi:hypothetical protein